METSTPKDLDFEPNTSPAKQLEQDLIGDVGDINLSSKIEPSIKPVTPEHNLLESVGVPSKIDIPIGITVDEHKIDADILKEIAKEPEIKETKVINEIEPVQNIEPLVELVQVKEPIVDPLQVKEPVIESQQANEPLIKSQQIKEPLIESHPLKEEPHVGMEPFGFNKPLPPEPLEITGDFLKAETNSASKVVDDKDDDLHEFVGAASDVSPAALSREESPIPPPVPKHQSLRDESPDRFESSPEPDFKPMDSGTEIEDPLESPPVIPSTAPKQEEPKLVPPIEEVKKLIAGDIGAKDIIVEIVEVSSSHHRRRARFSAWLRKASADFIDAWFNPARLHPQVESLVYWRDPKKSGAVFGVILITLLSLTTCSLISVIAYLGLLTLAGTISFRVYKNIMQAIQKTSDGHPFKEFLEMDISLPEDKVAETSKIATVHINAAISALRSLFLVEDLVDSIKGLVLFWALTYLGALFNGLTLLIIGVILIFSLPRLYEKNKSQADAYIQIAMDKLSIITNRLRGAFPSGKKDEKPKDQ